MDRDDEITELRAHLIGLEAALNEAKKRLDLLEQAPSAEIFGQGTFIDVEMPHIEPPVLPIEPPTEDAQEPVSPSAPVSVPPPLPWERKPAEAHPLCELVSAARSHVPLDEETESSRIEPLPWSEPTAKMRRRYGPPEDMDFETALGAWWLPRIGIVILSIGVVFLLTYVGNQLFSGWLRPYLQVAGGYAACAGLLIGAKRLEESARNYARVLASGGFALSYFTTFAAHFVVRPPVIGSEILTGLLLFAVVLSWGVVAQRRKSPLLGLGVTLLGHLTIFLSLKSADTGAGLSTASLLLFSLGSAFFLVKNRWYSVGAAGMICSYLNLAVLLENQVFVSHTLSTVGAVALLAVVYAVFALAELFAPEDLRRRDIRLSLRSAFVAANTFCAVGLAWLLWNDTGGPLPGIHVLYGGAGLIVLVIARTYYHARQGDPLYNIYQIKGLTLLTLAFAKYLSGEQFAVTLAVEALLLLLNASVTGFVVSRVFSILCAGLSAGLMCFMLYQLGPAMKGHENPGVVYAMWLVFAVLHAAGVVYLKMDWRTRGLKADAVPVWSKTLLQQCDLLDTAPTGGPFVLRVAALGMRPAWPLLLSLAAFAPWVMWLVPGQAGGLFWRGEAIAAVSLLILGMVGVALRAWSLTIALPFFATCLWAAMLPQFRPIEHRWQVPYRWDVGIIALAFLLLAEVARVSRHRDPALWPRLFWRPRGSAHWFALLAAPVLFQYLMEVAPAAEMAWTCALVALFFALYTAATNAVFWQTVILFQGTAAIGVLLRSLDVTYSIGEMLPILLAMAVPAFLAQPDWLPGRAGLERFRQLPIALWLSGAFWLALFVLCGEFQSPLQGYLHLTAAVLALVLSRFLDARVLSLVALLTIWGAMISLVLEVQVARDAHWKQYMLALIALSFATERTMRARGVWLGARLHDFAISGALLASLLLVFVVVQGPLEDTLAFAVGAAFLLYAGRGKLYITGALGGLLAIVATILAVQGQLGELERYPLLGPIATTGAALAFWAVVEGGLRTRGTSDNQRGIANLLALLVCGLLLCMLSQIDALANFYLTIAWTLAAVAMMAAGAYSGQAYYRYGGLATFGIVTLRAALWDTRHLELISRTISWMLLGIVLLVVAYGYIRARGKKE